MKKAIILIVTIVIFASAGNSQNQSKVWHFSEHTVNFSTGTPVVSAITNSNGYQVEQDAANGIYGPNNEFLVHIEDNYIYDNTGSQVGGGGIGTTPPASMTNIQTLCNLNLAGSRLAQSTAVVPVPGSCTKYYLIYFDDIIACSPLEHYFDLRYSIYDLSTNSVSIPKDISPSESTGSNDFHNYSFGDIAVSKLRADNTRILYAAGEAVNYQTNPGVIKRYVISSTGISPGFEIYSTTVNLRHAELDLSPDGTKLAWANIEYESNVNPPPYNDPDAFVINLSADGYFNGITQYTINTSQQFTGVEFSPDNTKLYVGARTKNASYGIYQLDLATGSNTFVSGSDEFGSSQLELAYDPNGQYKIYAARSSTVLGVISSPNSPSPSLTDNAITFNTASVIRSWVHGFINFGMPLWTLPKQIDGEKNSRAADLYIQDYTDDIGIEPNPSSNPMWISTDIWVRRNSIPSTVHEDPVYKSNNDPNYVYVRVHNRGCTSSTSPSPSYELKLYWAKASSALSWPDYWNGNKKCGGTNIEMGGLIGTQTIPVIAPGGEAVIPFNWVVPNPDTYLICNGDNVHFCLLARIESTSDPMARTEIADVHFNIKHNNNIASKNVNVMPGPGPHIRQMIVRNVYDAPVLSKLTFDIPADEASNSYLNYGSVTIDLGSSLFNKWTTGGSVGSGVEVCSGDLLHILEPNAWIGNISLDSGDYHVISADFKQDVLQTNICELNYDIAQTDSVISDTTYFTGGVRFGLETCKFITTLIASTPVLCKGGNSGTATITSLGWFGPFTYLWNNGLTASAITGLTTGTYTVTIQDQNSNIAVETTIISQPSAMTVSTGGTHVSCNGGNNGAATVSVTGGTTAYSYLWSTSSTNTAISSLTAATYNVTVTDANSCTATSSKVISQPSALTISGVSNPVCAGSTLNLSSAVSGGTSSYSYSWSGPDSFSSTLSTPSITTVTGSACGVYTLTVTDAHSCTATANTTSSVTACLNLTFFLQGYYINSSGGAMRDALNNGGCSACTTCVDTFTIELRNTGSPYAVFESTTAILNTNGTASAIFSCAALGTSKYIAIKHSVGSNFKHTVQTWSASGVSISSNSTTSYNFSTAASQAYSSNQIQVESGIYAFYVADINQDQNVDNIDWTYLDADIINGYYGCSYFTHDTDLNGDGNTDLTDFPIWEANANAGIFSRHP